MGKPNNKTNTKQYNPPKPAKTTQPTQTPEQKAIAEEAQRQLLAQLQQQVVGLHAGNPTEFDKEVNYIMASDGVYCSVENAVGVYTTKVMEPLAKVKSVDAFPSDVEEGIKLKVPKIPFKYWLMIHTFYKDVYDKDKTEAAALFFWNHDNKRIPTEYEPRVQGGQPEPVKGVIEDGQLIIYCPIQYNSAGLTEYKDDPMYHWLRDNTTKFVETHSH